MKKSKIILLLLPAALAVLFLVAMPSRAVQSAAASNVVNVRTADFAWMTGRWIGRLQNGTAEQICSTPQSGEMLCLFRIFVKGKPVMYELYSLSDTPRGPELRSLHFPADLEEKSLQQPLVLTLQKYSEKEVVFAGAPGMQVASSSLFRDSPTTMDGIIMFADQKAPHVRVRWEKVAYDTPVDYGSQRGRFSLEGPDAAVVLS
jgi:uncharacterized protein DUF6265